MMPTWMYLLRHGATRLNLEKPYRLQGSGINEPLSTVGIEDSQAVRDLLRHVPLRAVYSSPLLRAQETAQIVARPHGLAVQSIVELIEGSVGRWENRSWEEIRKNEPLDYERFVADPARYGYPGGENFAQVGNRVRPVLSELLSRHEAESFVVVGHQIINRVYLAEIMGLSMSAARTLKFANGGISLVTMENLKPLLVSLNLHWPASVARD